MSSRQLQNSPRTETALGTLIRVYGLVKRIMEPYFTGFGISGSHWGILRALHRAEREGLTGLRLTDLGDRLLIRPPSVTGAIDRLLRMGLVARNASPTDMRAKHVSLTDEGRKLVDRVRRNLPARAQFVLGGLDGTQQRTLQELLNRLGSHLEPIVEQEEKSGHKV